MLGVLVNTFAIIGCSILGLIIEKLMSDRIENVLMQALGICVFVVGMIDAINPVNGTEGILVMIISFVIGGFIGSLLNIEKGFTKLGEGFEKLFNSVTACTAYLNVKTLQLTLICVKSFERTAFVVFRRVNAFQCTGE